jgi:hypothetical protein
MNDQQIPVEKLVKIYLKMRGKHDELLQQFKQQEEALKDQMTKIKGALLDHCKEHNVESVRTTEGLFFRTTKQSYWTNDWESMGKFVIEHNAPELFEKRLHQGNVKQFLEEHPELLPPGLNVESQYSVTVRRK